ncbi:25188_t:CDS:1, partial [Gigaspora rosea]
MKKLKSSEKDKKLLIKLIFVAKSKTYFIFLPMKEKYAGIFNQVAHLYAIRLISYKDEDENEVNIMAVK